MQVTSLVSIPLIDLMDLTSRFKNNCFTEMCSGSEEGSYIYIYVGSRVIKKQQKI